MNAGHKVVHAQVAGFATWIDTIINGPAPTVSLHFNKISFNCFTFISFYRLQL